MNFRKTGKSTSKNKGLRRIKPRQEQRKRGGVWMKSDGECVHMLTFLLLELHKTRPLDGARRGPAV